MPLSSRRYEPANNIHLHPRMHHPVCRTSFLDSGIPADSGFFPVPCHNQTATLSRALYQQKTYNAHPG